MSCVKNLLENVTHCYIIINNILSYWIILWRQFSQTNCLKLKKEHLLEAHVKMYLKIYIVTLFVYKILLYGQLNEHKNTQNKQKMQTNIKTPQCIYAISQKNFDYMNIKLYNTLLQFIKHLKEKQFKKAVVKFYWTSVWSTQQ